MCILFVTRRNVHAKYYKKLNQHLTPYSKLYLMGKVSLNALLMLPQALPFSLDDIIDKQIARKQAKQPKIWTNKLVMNSYRFLQTCVERVRIANYLYLFGQQKPKKVVIWNGKKLPNQTVDLVAKHLKIPVYYFENGLLPNTTSLDPNGVNQAASLPKNPSFYYQFMPSEVALRLPQIEARKPHKKRQSGQAIDLPKRFIFVPFQVPHDTQIVQYSPWIESMEKLFHTLLNAHKTLEDEQLDIVFKEHPSWHKHYHHLYDIHPNVLFANDNDTSQLISQAEVVVTINSTVGLEALQLNKKVIILGQACYDIDGLCLHARNQAQLNAVLKSVDTWQPNQKLRESFFHYLKHYYCISGNWNTPNKAHFVAVEQRLLAQDSFSHHVSNQYNIANQSDSNTALNNQTKALQSA